tara:strand:- start:437 stop:1363 length:927 start_codon:yes stop_codon:yes gene_type:complete
MKLWVRLYTEVLVDPKMGSLTWEQKGVWYTLVALAGMIDDRDEEESETGRLDTIVNVAWHLRPIAPDEMDGAIAAFTERDMIELRDDILYLTNYRKRNSSAVSDRPSHVAERVKRHRNKQKKGRNESETPLHRGRNENVTTPDKNRIDKNRIDKKRKDTRADKTSADVVDPAGSPVSDDNSLSKSECDTIRKALEASFVEVSGLSPPTLTTAAQKRTAGQLWFAPLRAIAEETDWDAATGQQLIQATVDKMVADGLTISSPKSILNTSRSVMADARRGKSVTAGLSKNESSTLGALTRVAERLEHGES